MNLYITVLTLCFKKCGAQGTLHFTSHIEIDWKYRLLLHAHRTQARQVTTAPGDEDKIAVLSSGYLNIEKRPSGGPPSFRSPPCTPF